MGIIAGGQVIEGAATRTFQEVIGEAALDNDAILAAVTDDGTEQIITTSINPLDRVRRITATAGGTAADIKAIQVEITGEDGDGNTITETLPAFTANTAGTVTGVKHFLKVTKVVIPAHDDTGATTSIGAAGVPAAADTDGVLGAVTDDGTEQEITSGINSPDVARNITATSAGTAGDIGAIQVVIEGEDIEGNTMTETLPAFTVDTAETVAGSKAFAKVTKVTIPAHDGTGATTAIGFGAKLGLGQRLSRNTGRRGWLGGTLEGTDPTFTVDASAIESNTVDLNSALDGSQVVVEYLATH